LGGQLFDTLLRRLADRPEADETEEEAFEEEIRSIVTEGLYDGVLEEDAGEMIESVIELGDETVSHIMTPRSNIDALDVESSWAEVLRFVVEVGRTRIPVYEDHLDNLIGVLYVKDLLRELRPDRADPHRHWKQLVRDPWFVPTTKPLDEMLQEFLQTRQHLAVVVDEYRAVAGVVTIEDVLEEIVGEIVDESDKDEQDCISRLGEGVAEVLGSAHVDVVNERLGLDLPEPEECDTLAGLIITELGRIPSAGESFTIQGTRITVLEASRRRLERLRLETGGKTASAAALR
jgi:CBS domain containing-hemolysin-like protein